MRRGAARGRGSPGSAGRRAPLHGWPAARVAVSLPGERGQQLLWTGAVREVGARRAIFALAAPAAGAASTGRERRCARGAPPFGDAALAAEQRAGALSPAPPPLAHLRRSLGPSRLVPRPPPHPSA